ncbi:MAG: hypothetical protein RSE93_01865 [Oscillospiraceae bacterium]
MQDNLRVNMPIQNVPDTNSKIRPTKDPSVQTPIDPTRVINQGNQAENTQQSKNDNLGFLFNKGSVFNKFIQQLNSTPLLAQTLKKVVFEAFAGSVQKSEKLNTELAKLADTLKLSEDQIVSALQYQNENQTKFTGSLFDKLRQLLSDHQNSKEFELLLGNFLKSFNGYSSTNSTLKAIVFNLKNMTMYMPKTYSDKLEIMINKLSLSGNFTFEEAVDALGQNLAVLKNEVVPFFNSYVRATNDFGKVRDMITILISNIARLNTSSQQDVVEKFVDLIEFCKFTFEMPQDEIEVIKHSFTTALSNPNNESDKMFDSISNLIKEGMSEENPLSTRNTYKDIATSLLLDKNVFMPFNHYVLPFNYNNTFVFSELWVEKEAHKKQSANSVEPITRLFLNFDIRGVGYFEAVMWLSKDSMDLEFNYPSTIPEKAVKDGISKIFAQNGINLKNLSLAKDKPARKIQEVFKFSTRRGVDVVI